FSHVWPTIHGLLNLRMGCNPIFGLCKYLASRSRRLRGEAERGTSRGQFRAQVAVSKCAPGMESSVPRSTAAHASPQILIRDQDPLIALRLLAPFGGE